VFIKKLDLLKIIVCDQVNKNNRNVYKNNYLKYEGAAPLALAAFHANCS
jgi:hypothetical protein